MIAFSPASLKQRFRWFNLTATILLVGLIVRLVVFAIVVLHPQRAFSISDSAGYTLLAHNMTQSGSFSLSTDSPLTPDIDRTPGYPVFLSILYIVAGNRDSAALIVGVQLGISLVSIYLLTLIGRLLFDRNIAAMAGLIYALAPAAIAFTGFVMTETLFAALLLLGIYATLKVRGSAAPWSYAILAGLAFGLSVLVRPIGLYFVPLPMLALVMHYGWQRRALLLAFTMLMSFAVTLAPWFYRNYIDFHSLIFSSLANSNLLIYNVGSVEAQRQHITWREGKDQLWQELTVEIIKHGTTPLNASEMSGLMGSLAIKHILAHPLDAFIYQTLDLTNSFRPGYSTLGLLLEDGNTSLNADPQQFDSAVADSANTLTQNKLIDILITIFYGVFFPLIAVGVVMLLWKRKWIALVSCGLIPLWFIYVPGIAGNARFRAPIEGLLAILAAVPLAWILERLRTRVRRQEQPDT